MQYMIFAREFKVCCALFVIARLTFFVSSFWMAFYSVVFFLNFTPKEVSTKNFGTNLF